MLDEPFPVTGARGLIKHAFRTAAEVTKFHVAMDRKTYRGALTGTVVTSDPFLLTQMPLVFVVPSRRPMRWPVEAVHVTPDGQLVARLGALEGM
jgi:hypothetical protein